LSYADGSHFFSLALHIPLEFLPRKKETNPPDHFMIVGQEKSSSKKGDCGAPFILESKCFSIDIISFLSAICAHLSIDALSCPPASGSLRQRLHRLWCFALHFVLILYRLFFERYPNQ
jgi:hypothetical protein